MNSQALLALERLQLITSVDSTRTVSDPFRLTAALLSLVTARQQQLWSRIQAAGLAEGDRAGASVVCRTSLTRLERWHRCGLRFLDGLLPADVPDNSTGTGPHIPDHVRLQLQTAYGFDGGVAGIFTDDRTEALASLAAVAVNVPVANPLWHYPQDLRDVISADFALLQAHQALATGGSRQVATAAVATALEEGEHAITRARGWYISCSDLGDRTAELAKIGLQPRRAAGEASSGVEPGPAGTAVYDAGAKTLTIPEVPANSSGIRAYRQVAGGPRELCGISLTPVVSIVMVGPLVPGTVYEAWVVGVLENREGPESNRVSFTA